MKVYRSICATPVLALFLITGCDRDEIKVYDLAKEKPPVAPAETASPLAPSADSQPATPKHAWPAPADWQEQTPGPMQDGKFLVANGKATVTISIFQGATGGTLANVNRWRTQQLGLPKVDQAALPNLLTPLDLPDTKANLVDMTGPKQRMVAAIVPRGEQTWFFKLLGEDAAVAAEKERFLDFVKAAK